MSKSINIGFDKEYKNWLKKVKAKIQSSQIKAAIAVNSALIEFYWDLGKMIVDKQKYSNWGNKLIEQLSKDLKMEFPGMAGFSRRNLYYVAQFYIYFSDFPELNSIVHQVGAQLENASVPQAGAQKRSSIIFQVVRQLPWGHIKLLISKIKDNKECLFYIQETISNNWSRDILGLQIKSDLYKRHGKAITNFKNTLPVPQSDLANQTIKDPYVFDFMTLSKPFVEKDIENQLVSHITNFLLELGKGFAFIGRQYHLEVSDNDYYLDLLFYHVKLKCYVVIELKNTKFIPEYAGKMNFYLSAVDSTVKDKSDNPTIGILLCRDKDNIDVEFALRDINKPMGVSEFTFSEIIPEDLKSSLPTIEEIENELKKESRSC
jgi:predicted nuclease of restriction endonuclease-like (RecB) superfamily